jgi:hypothetical protein
VLLAFAAVTTTAVIALREPLAAKPRPLFAPAP